jgi:hypothetical protein
MTTRLKERVVVVNKDNTVTNKDGKSVAFVYKLRLNESKKPVVRQDGVHAVDSVGGVIVGETGYISGDAIQTIFGFMKDTTKQNTQNYDMTQQETTYLIPVFLERFQEEVYIHTSNIKFV